MIRQDQENFDRLAADAADRGYVLNRQVGQTEIWSVRSSNKVKVEIKFPSSGPEYVMGYGLDDDDLDYLHESLDLEWKKRPRRWLRAPPRGVRAGPVEGDGRHLGSTRTLWRWPCSALAAWFARRARPRACESAIGQLSTTERLLTVRPSVVPPLRRQKGSSAPRRTRVC